MIARLIQALMSLLFGAVFTFAVAAVSSIFGQRNYERTWPSDTSQVWWADPQHLVEPNVDCQATEIGAHRSIINSTWATEREPPLACKRGYVVLVLRGFGVTEQHALASHHHDELSLTESFRYRAMAMDEYMQDIYQLLGRQQRAIEYFAAWTGLNQEVLLQTGWPLKAFSGLQIAKNEKESNGLHLIDGCLVVSSRWNEREHPWIIPVRPLWVGLAANTLLYAGTLWALSLVPGSLRRLLRRRKRLCHCCGYPIGVSEVCTECGVELAEWAVLRARARRPEAAR